MRDGIYTGKYIGETRSGFVNGNMYEFDLYNNGRTYELKGLYDITDGGYIETPRAFMTYASELSIRKNWEVK